MTTRVPVVAEPTQTGGDPDFCDPIVHVAQVVPRDIELHETKRDGTQMDLRAIEDRLLERGMDIVDGVMRFADLSPQDMEDPHSEPPPSMIEELGIERAHRVFTAAKQGWQNSKNAPVGITVAQNMVKSIIKSRSTQMAAPTTLNVAIIDNSKTYQYNEVEVEDD